MSTPIFANFVNTSLAAAISPSSTTILLASSAGLPTLSAGQFMPLILNDAATKSIYEVVYVTAITGASLTVTRAQEGTTALSWGVGDYAYSTNTAQTTFQLASNAEAQGLAVDNKAITPATLSSAFQGSNQSLSASGFQKIPGGLILQWGLSGSIASGASQTITFPTTFPNACLEIVASLTGNIPNQQYSNATNILSTSQFVIGQLASSGASAIYRWVAVGN